MVGDGGESGQRAVHWGQCQYNLSCEVYGWYAGCVRHCTVVARKDICLYPSGRPSLWAGTVQQSRSSLLSPGTTRSPGKRQPGRRRQKSQLGAESSGGLKAVAAVGG